jgi:hypothetical protein
MKFLSKLSFKSLVTIGAVAMVVSSAYAASYSVCNPPCTGYAQNAYTSAKASYAAQQTAYCNGLSDPNAKSACLASVPAASEQQAQGAYTYVYNECMRSCLAS